MAAASRPALWPFYDASALHRSHIQRLPQTVAFVVVDCEVEDATTLLVLGLLVQSAFGE